MVTPREAVGAHPDRAQSAPGGGQEGCEGMGTGVTAIGVAICVPVLALLFTMAMERLERALLGSHPPGAPGAGDHGTEDSAAAAAGPIGPVALPGRRGLSLRSAGRSRPAGAVTHRREVTDSPSRGTRRRGGRRAGRAQCLEDARRVALGDEQADEA